MAEVNPEYTQEATGMLKHTGGKLHVECVPVDWEIWLAQGMQYGAFDKKPVPYGLGNWQKGGKASSLMSALRRHTQQVLVGEWSDPDSGLPHLVHAAMNALMIVSLKQLGRLEDDLQALRGVSPESK